MHNIEVFWKLLGISYRSNLSCCCFLFFSPSPLQISGNLTVPWITGCSRKRAVSTFPFKYLMRQVKEWKVYLNVFFFKCQFYLCCVGFFFFLFILWLIQTLSADTMLQLPRSWCVSLKAGQSHNPESINVMPRYMNSAISRNITSELIWTKSLELRIRFL